MSKNNGVVILKNYYSFKSFIFNIKSYYIFTNRLPQNVEDLYHNPQTNYPELMKDAWGNDFIIKALGDSCIVVKCLGQDKQEGGHGINGDWIYKISVKYDKVNNSSEVSGTIISIPSKAEFYFEKDKVFWHHYY